MEELINVVDWSRAQFALTAIYHWLFVPLTLGLGIIVAVMETIYFKTKSEKWLATTKFWMTIFGVNFAIGVATGIILEFEFGTNWSNYSWFVGDIFGAPLASALWILVANAWMQYPTGCEFNPATMRNEMTSFAAVALSPMAMSKFFHTVLSAWALGGVFVCGVCGWMMLKKRNIDHCWRSLKVGAWVGVIGIVLTMVTGDTSAVTVAKYQPMKLAAMEGLYKGNQDQAIVAFGILNPSKQAFDDQDPYLFDISIPYGLSFLATHDFHAFVPGIEDIINGVSYDAEGNLVNTVSYAERMERGKRLQEMMAQYSAAMNSGNTVLQDSLKSVINTDFKHFGYAYQDRPEEAIPNVPLTFYTFHFMVTVGGYLLVFLLLALLFVYKPNILNKAKWAKWWHILAIITIPLTYLCSASGWIVAEVGRQPWTIQDLMPNKVAISDLSAGYVQTTFWIFAVVFTALLIADIGIICKQISKKSQTNLDTVND